MINKIIPFTVLLLAVLSGCKKETPPPEFTYNYTINRNLYMDGNILVDSLVYYYNTDDVLLKVARCSSGQYCSDYVVGYHPDYIDNWNGDYYFDDESRVVLINNSGYITEFEYDENKRTYEKHSVNNIVIREVFYVYDKDNLSKDSLVIYETDGHVTSTVSHYAYADTLRPSYMVDYSGLHEIPPFSSLLVKEVISQSYTDSIKENSYYYKYDYEIINDRTTQNINFFDDNGSKDKSLKIEYTIEWK